MKDILEAILAGARRAEFDALPYRPVPRGDGARDEEGMFKRPPPTTQRESLHIEDVPMPELGPGEALVAVMASAINYNTVWTSIFEPMSTFASWRETSSSR